MEIGELPSDLQQIFTLALTVLTILGVAWGSEIIMARCCLVIGPTLWAFCVFFIRASIGDLYVRLFPVRSFHIACYIVLFTNTLFVFTIVITSCLICRPLAYIWDASIGGVCGNQKTFDLFTAIFNLLLDLSVVTLPMPILWGLQMRTRKKVMLSLLFSMGIA